MAPIRSLLRSLRLISSMNESRAFSINELHQATGLPKSTIHRILLTLRSDAYVIMDDTGSYRLAGKILEVTKGYTEKSILVEAGASIARDVTKRVKWPVAIGTLEETAIVIRFSTLSESPLALRSTLIGHRAPLLSSAMGTAYLSFCSKVEQDVLIQAILKSKEESSVDRGVLAKRFSVVRRRGYGLRLPARPGESATLAVPIHRGETVLGLLGMITFGNLMNPQTIEKHLPILKEAAEKIAASSLERGKAKAT